MRSLSFSSIFDMGGLAPGEGGDASIGSMYDVFSEALSCAECTAAVWRGLSDLAVLSCSC